MSIKDVGKRANTELLIGNTADTQVVPENALLNPRVRIAIDFMKANLHRRAPLAELAEAVNLSPSHLCYLFKAQTGLSPGEYLRRVRMEKASHLLATSLLSVKEIMASVGYDKKSHFLRHFKRSFAIAPSEYRESVSHFQSAIQ